VRTDFKAKGKMRRPIDKMRKSDRESREPDGEFALRVLAYWMQSGERRRAFMNFFTADLEDYPYDEAPTGDQKRLREEHALLTKIAFETRRQYASDRFTLPSWLRKILM
jgi:hypothetical protein